ncbi:MAG: PQQ-dependent sugar dehydrogenase [Bacteroidetes bacterium]|nr:PQQ-dependent sugar dehydrogenase [Bacteroidota bacterium]
MRKIILTLAIFTVIALSVHSQTLPALYTQTDVITGLQYPVDFDWTPDGKYYVTQKGGTTTGSCANAKILVYNSAGALLSTFCDLTDSVICGGERGLLGIAIDPNFVTNHFVYAFYVHKAGTINEIRVVRWMEVANVGTNFTVILRLNLNTLGFAIQQYHYSGIIRFRPSQPDKLYVLVGEMYHNQTDTVATHNFGQMKNVPYGKILRINTDGSIPTDNPFYDDGNPATGNDDRIWSYGHRNMFGLCVNPVTDSLYEAENGLTTWDEFNIIHKGGNYGWNTCEGNFFNSSTTIPCPLVGSVLPLTTWGAPLPSVTGCMYYNGSAMSEFDNHILVGDNDYGIIYDLTMGNAPAYDIVTSKVAFADVVTAPAGLTTLRQGQSDGCIYAMKGGYTTSGTIFKICHSSSVGVSNNDEMENFIGQNYPNPTNGKTQIDYFVTQNSNVSIVLFDITGRKIKNILSSDVQSGKHTVELTDLDENFAGSYFYKMIVKQNNKIVYSETKRMLIVR